MMKTTLSNLVLMALAVAATGAYAQKREADPLASFKKVVAACEAHINGWPRETVRQLQNGEWVRNFLEVGAISHDVKRTDSLVSPFTAYIKIETSGHSVRRPSEDEARAADKEDGSANRGTDVIRYAFQDSKWRLVDGTTQREMRLRGEAVFKDPVGVVQLGADSFTGNPRWARCVP